MNINTAITVSQLNFYIKSLFEGDENLVNAFIIGEISNFTNHYKSGHFYFSLKDSKCVVKAIMFSTNAQRIRFRPEDGMTVLIRGRVSLYEQTGQYQIYVEDMQPYGLGALNLAFEQLKAKLEAEGLFSKEIKKALPKFPERIGVITSPTGAAIEDIKNVLKRRFSLATVVFCPVIVQGEQACEQIVNALNAFNKKDETADVIILGRGGGSTEDLWAFNDENVARAIIKSSIPIISAVGHETDFTICDFVADLRAPTPSAAAELAVPDSLELLDMISSYRTLIKRNMGFKINSKKADLLRLMQSRPLSSPISMVENRMLEVDFLAEKVSRLFKNKIDRNKNKFSRLVGKLNVLSPLNVLSRGYAMVNSENKNVIKSINQVKFGENLEVRIADGTLKCTVNDVKRL